MSTTERQIVEGVIDFWRKEVGWFTLDEAFILLRHLGCDEGDKILAQIQGYRHIAVRDLAHYFNGVEYCINIRPIYFHGGPIGGRRFKGTFLTFVLDRLLLVAHEKGAEHALTLVKYAKGFGTTSRKKNSSHGIVYSG
jgi:hypothetical protein